MELLLASKSPRRQELLRMMGLKFRLVHQNAEEHFSPGMDPSDVAGTIAVAKARALDAEVLKDDVALAADTIVVLDGEILGKPGDRIGAVRMLERLSGKQHRVITAVALRSGAGLTVFQDTTDVYFAPLSREEIDFYINSFQPFDKAGAYGLQEWIGFNKVTRINGSYTNVIGLPTEKLYAKLRADYPQLLSSSGRI